MQSADIQLRLEQQLVLINQALQDAIAGGSLSETERLAVLFDAQERIIVLLKTLVDDECDDECDDEFPDPIRSALDALQWGIEQLQELLADSCACEECCEDEEPQ